MKTTLQTREKQGNKRQLKLARNGSDFYSNDYLGMAQNQAFHRACVAQIQENPTLLAGSTGSRLISGTSALMLETEDRFATRFGVDASLFLSSGYVANIALFGSFSNRKITCIVDEKVHRSVHDGCRLAQLKKWKFRHNDLNHLEALLKRADGPCIIAVESLYSMDGDMAPLVGLAELASRYEAQLIVDEAHAFGVFHDGLVPQLGLQKKVFATVITFGKALGLHGALILGSKRLKDYLINFSSPFIFTTAPPDYMIWSVEQGMLYLDKNPELRQRLFVNINAFQQYGLNTTSNGKSPIQALIVPDVKQLERLATDLEGAKIIVQPIFSPTVPKGEERLRICLHSFNNSTEMARMADIINQELKI